MSETYATWPEAAAAVEAWARGLTVYWGTGNPIPRAHVVTNTLDAWSGEGKGYFAVERTAKGEFVRAAYFYVA